jgi:putative endonuclease
LYRGRLGEEAARRYLQAHGLKFLTANYATRRGEIDLIFRDADGLAFVEVKTRSREDWSRPAAAVTRKKKRRLSLAALDYLRELGHVRVAFRFDIVEVLVEDREVRQIRYLRNAFPLACSNYYR